jgi:uncharacterized protein (TIGR03000 family)
LALLIPAFVLADETPLPSAPCAPGIAGPAAPLTGPVTESVGGPAVGPVGGAVFGPAWGYGHWIYDYFPPHSADPYGTNRYGYDRRPEDRTGKNYRGRETLAPAVPYSDYLANQRKAAMPQATAERALIEIVVPDERARVWFDNELAEGEGKVRYFNTPSLKAGQEYRFKIKVAWPSNDPFNDHTGEQVLTFRAGEHKRVEFRTK